MMQAKTGHVAVNEFRRAAGAAREVVRESSCCRMRTPHERCCFGAAADK